MTVSVNWFEIPVVDVARAAEFYGLVLGVPLESMEGPDGEMTVFPGVEGAAGALLPVDQAPVAGGVTIYLGCADIDAALARAQSAGGAIEQPKTPIGPHGFIGCFKDTEGNLVALHTPA